MHGLLVLACRHSSPESTAKRAWPLPAHPCLPIAPHTAPTLTMATAEARGRAAMSSARSAFTSSPVLILTGHFSWHMPSAAQVSLASYSKARDTSSRRACCAAVRGSMERRRYISLYTAMRWRGVSVTSLRQVRRCGWEGGARGGGRGRVSAESWQGGAGPEELMHGSE